MAKRREQLTAEEVTAVNLAIGRIVGMMQRTQQPGDLAEYGRCRSLIMDLLDDGYAHVALKPPASGWNFGSGTSGRIE